MVPSLCFPMSVQSESESQPQPNVPPEDVFGQCIWYNPEVCSNCFARCRVIYEDVPNTGLSATPRSTSYRTDSATTGHDGTDHDEYGAIRTYEPATTCADCGSVRLLNQHDIMSASAMIDCVDALAERLDEQGIQVHREAMRRLIGRVKELSDAQGHDREIFERAVSFGIRQHRKRA